MVFTVLILIVIALLFWIGVAIIGFKGGGLFLLYSFGAFPLLFGSYLLIRGIKKSNFIFIIGGVILIGVGIYWLYHTIIANT